MVNLKENQLLQILQQFKMKVLEMSKELLMLNNLVSGYFDFAEFQAMKHKTMKMKNYINQLDKILDSLDAKIIIKPRNISHKKAIDKAKEEYDKYQIKELSPIEKEYLKSINEINEKIRN